MSRIHQYSFLLNSEGQPIVNAEISIYLAGTTTPATLYLDEFSTSSIDTAPQLNSNENGYFEYWISSAGSESGYNSAQKFKMVWDKTGIESGFIDYIDVYPSVMPVDESDTDNTKDKSISNELANLWESHRMDVDHTVHGIQEVNENDITLNKNKLISNNLAFEWDKHKSLTFSTETTSGSTYVMGTSAASGDYPHGIKPMDFSESLPSSAAEHWKMNRVVSYHYATKWENHLDDDYSDHPHGMEPIDGNDTNSELNKLMSNNLLKNLYDTIAALEVRIAALEA